MRSLCAGLGLVALELRRQVDLVGDAAGIEDLLLEVLGLDGLGRELVDVGGKGWRTGGRLRAGFDGIALELEQARPAAARAAGVGDRLVHRAALRAPPSPFCHGKSLRPVYDDVRGISTSFVFDPSSAEGSNTTSLLIESKFPVVKSKVPRVPVPEVAVTKFSSTTLPSAS